MLALKFHTPGTAPATLPTPDTASPPKIHLIQYDPTTIEEREIADAEEIWGAVTPGKVTWINIDGLGDVDLIRSLGEHFDLHPLALEDVFNTTQRPKIETYPGTAFIVTQMVSCEENTDVVFEQVSLFVKRNILITIQEEGARDVFEPVRQRLRTGGGFARSRGHDYLAYALLDAITDHYFPVLERMGEVLETLEEELIDKPTPSIAHRLHAVKRILIKLRRTAWPTRELLSSFLREESDAITSDTRLFLRDCYDHAVQILDVIETYRDLSSGLLEMYLSAIGMRTNEVMRVLTVISSMFIPLTFLAGIYGMNFENMPELKEPHAYFILLGVMAIISAGMILFFKRKRWL
jgi:magnesium transporter